MKSLKWRLILAGVFAFVLFFGALYYKLSAKTSFIMALVLFGVAMLLSDPKFQERDRERARNYRENKEYESRLGRDEYLREKARMKAKKDFRREKNQPLLTGLEPGLLNKAFSKSRKRR
ncbi:MAG: hypothetical protein PHV16_02485 [Candidatus Nanoarchaeia archaeon]|nr:hypothetical protein [Candidatus Nanoarchaeia archaeon]